LWRIPVTRQAVETLLEVENHEYLGKSAGIVCSGDGGHTELFLSSLSHGKTLDSTTGAVVGVEMAGDVAHDLPLHLLLAMAEPTMSPADKRAVANFILTVRLVTGGSDAGDLMLVLRCWWFAALT
jgi:hypothetical protein